MHRFIIWKTKCDNISLHLTLYVLIFIVLIIIDQANLGMILSPVKSVGKSLSAKMLAYAQGVPGVKHNQLLAGGDQVLSGVSS